MKKIIESFKPSAIELNNFMADNPEISGKEYLASEKIVELLRSRGIEVEYPFAGLETAFKGVINPQYDRKCAILVEYDALRGIGHGCGHSASGAISILSALVLNEIKNEIPAQIQIIGTPDEEMGGGKVVMANKGVFNGLDFAIMIHMGNKNSVGANFLALDQFNLTFHGAPAHAAGIPWEGRNALNAMRLFFDALDMMRQHVKPDARLHGYIQHGGDASNIIPHLTKAEVLVRAKDRDYVDELSEWLENIAKGAALATKTTYELELGGEKYDGLVRNEAGEALLSELYNELGLELKEVSEPTGSSDIGNVSSICPAFHPYLNIGDDILGHTVEFANAMKTEKTYDQIANGAYIISSFVKRIYDENIKL